MDAFKFRDFQLKIKRALLTKKSDVYQNNQNRLGYF